MFVVLHSDMYQSSINRLDEYFEAIDQIGRGGFGVVFHVKNTMDQKDYALKIVRLSGM